MNKSQATAISAHLHSDIYLVAQNTAREKTWGYKVAVSERNYTTVELGDYRQLQATRRDSRQRLVDDLLSGDAPEWATLDFQW